jgi:hypothetical protein
LRVNVAVSHVGFPFIACFHAWCASFSQAKACLGHSRK